MTTLNNLDGLTKTVFDTISADGFMLTECKYTDAPHDLKMFAWHFLTSNAPVLKDLYDDIDWNGLHEVITQK